MRVGIDASNLRAGGGVTHLVELLRAAKPSVHEFEQVVVWAGATTLACLPEAPWLVKAHAPVLDGHLPGRLLWQRKNLAAQLQQARCDVLFSPGGSYGGRFHPFVTMSRNLLPFDATERRRYGLSTMAVKLRLLKLGQSATLRRADGVIFLNDYARAHVTGAVGTLHALARVIPHGVDRAFRHPPRVSRPIDARTPSDPLRVLYVSNVEVYKHQWHVVEAVGSLRSRGLAVSLELIGAGREPALTRLRRAIARVDPGGAFIHYEGPQPHAELARRYHDADLFVFASSCENMPNILLEAMAAGLPIACAARGPMPAMLGDAGVYFDPESPSDIERAVDALLQDPALRGELARRATARAAFYSWERCASETMAFLRDVLRKGRAA